MGDRTDALNALSWPQLQKVASANEVEASKKDAILDELEQVDELKVPEDEDIVAVFKDPSAVEKKQDEPKSVPPKGERRKIEDVNARGDWVDPFSGLRVYYESVVCQQSGARRDGDYAVLPERG